MLRFMGSKRVRHDWATELTDINIVGKKNMVTPWKKSYDQPRQPIKKQKHFLPSKFHLVKAMVFPVVKYGCESWSIKKVEH